LSNIKARKPSVDNRFLLIHKEVVVDDIGKLTWQDVPV